MLAALVQASVTATRQRNLDVPTPEGFHRQAYDLEVQAAPAEMNDRPGVWHSQYSQDVVIAKLTGHKTRGYFIDLAANDAFLVSNSRTLERDYGYSGMCIEPNPFYHQNLLKYRNCTVIAAAVSNAAGPARFDFRQDGKYKEGGKGVYGKLVASTSRSARAAESTSGDTTRDVWLATFAEIIKWADVPRAIDFLSLDVEGHEEQAMTTFPWRSHTIDFVAVEIITTKRTPQRLHHNLTSHGLRHICSCSKTANDALYARDEAIAYGSAKNVTEVRRYLERVYQGLMKPMRCERLQSLFKERTTTLR